MYMLHQTTKPKFRFLTAWFCPYAHRATIALQHHKLYIDYEWVEALGWYQGTSNNGNETNSNDDGTTDSNSNNDNKEWYYHWKADELKRVNPSALVPTLIPIQYDVDSGAEKVDESKAVYESLVTIDYIDLVATQFAQQQQQKQHEGTAPSKNSTADTTSENDNETAAAHKEAQFTSLVPYSDPYEVARCRIWVDKVNRECCSPYYDVLVRQDPMERQEYFSKLLQGIANFSKELNKTSGALFLPNNQLSNVDVALFPWAYRYYVLQHYCGPQYIIPTQDPTYTLYHEWYKHMMTLHCIQETIPDPERYLDHIQKYANGTARSKVANAVRRGVPAHDIDDEKDEYVMTVK